MNSVEERAAHWPKENVHFEHFGPVASFEPSVGEKNQPFQIKIARTGEVYEVPSDKTIVETLAEHGISIMTSCEEGYCGSCLTRFVEGEPEHRDSVLDDEMRREYLLACCARSKTPFIVLGL